MSSVNGVTEPRERFIFLNLIFMVNIFFLLHLLKGKNYVVFAAWNIPAFNREREPKTSAKHTFSLNPLMTTRDFLLSLKSRLALFESTKLELHVQLNQGDHRDLLVFTDKKESMHTPHSNLLHSSTGEMQLSFSLAAADTLPLFYLPPPLNLPPQ